MADRRRNGDYSISTPPSVVNDDIDHATIALKYETDEDYAAVCTNNLKDVPKEEREQSNNDHKSYDCNFCARLCY